MPNEEPQVLPNGEAAATLSDRAGKSSVSARAAVITGASIMSPVPLRQELQGRLRNIGKLTNWFMAVAEAVRNSLDAIEDSGRPGSVDVFLERAESLLAEEPRSGPIVNVLVRDSGIGFTESNFESFCTADSLHKLAKGGKGVGRLHCLQAFHEFQADSVFNENQQWKRRKFVLRREAPELVALVDQTSERTLKTDVRLATLRSKFQGNATIKLGLVADWLVEHFLPALVEKPNWLQKLVVHDGGESADLTELVKAKSEWSVSFQIGNYQFKASCYSLHGNGDQDQVRLVAAGRVVYANTRELEFYLPHVSTISASNPHVILVTSPFLDEHVNEARNGVSFSEEGVNEVLGVSAPDFRMKLGEALAGQLPNRITESVNELKSKVEKLVAEQAPHYKPLLLSYFDSKEFESLSRTARDEEILTALDTFRRRDSGKLRDESRRIAKMKSDTAGYLESARKLVGAVEMQKKVALAEYVGFRKIVLDRLEELLAAKENGIRNREEAVHNLIFPQGIDTETTPAADHQLWIVDERFESHRYLASDKAMDGKRGDRPDMLIALDRSGAFTTDLGTETQPYNRIVLVELKRALEDLSKVSTDDLPHRQMIRYARQIEKGKALHLKSRRPITLTSDARFYLYAVCELPDALKERLARDERFTLSPTGDGAFAVSADGRYYMEYISLPKLLADAKARNSAFFRRLGLAD